MNEEMDSEFLQSEAEVCFVGSDEQPFVSGPHCLSGLYLEPDFNKTLAKP